MVLPVDINYLAVLGSAIASMVIGFLWFGPLFGKQWMKYSGMTAKDLKRAKQGGMSKMYMVAFAGTLLMSYVLAHFVDFMQAKSLMDALQLGFWVWLGFIVTVLLSSVLWEGKPVQLYLLNIVYHLVTISAMSVILTLWV